MVEDSCAAVLIASNPFQSAARHVASSCACVRRLLFFGPNLHLDAVAGDEHISSAVPTTTPSTPRHAGTLPMAPRFLSEDDRAAVLFTSGSTNKPKAVAHSHHTLLWNVHVRYEATRELWGQRDCATLCLLPLFHQIGHTNNFIFNGMVSSSLLIHTADRQITPPLCSVRGRANHRRRRRRHTGTAAANHHRRLP
jgi:acyl-coenzyme A synthetase/AMP-(fatty) acid ligase